MVTEQTEKRFSVTVGELLIAVTEILGELEEWGKTKWPDTQAVERRALKDVRDKMRALQTALASYEGENVELGSGKARSERGQSGQEAWGLAIPTPEGGAKPTEGGAIGTKKVCC